MHTVEAIFQKDVQGVLLFDSKDTSLSGEQIYATVRGDEIRAHVLEISSSYEGGDSIAIKDFVRCMCMTASMMNIETVIEAEHTIQIDILGQIPYKYIPIRSTYGYYHKYMITGMSEIMRDDYYLEIMHVLAKVVNINMSNKDQTTFFQSVLCNIIEEVANPDLTGKVDLCKELREFFSRTTKIAARRNLFTLTKGKANSVQLFKYTQNERFKKRHTKQMLKFKNKSDNLFFDASDIY